MVVTGASGNLGAAVVARLQRARAAVVALTRKEADLADEAQVESAYDNAVEGHGPLWASVHCAGGWAGATVAQTSVDVLERMLEINLRSAFLCCRAALRRMRGEGRIVNVAALTAATFQGMAGAAAYNGVRANCVAPGTLRTAANGNLAGQVPLEDVAEAIFYLVSPEAGAVNGAVLTLAGR